MATGTMKQVRFAKLLEVGGEPRVHLPFSDPEKDKDFMRAAKEERVVTIKQDPTSKQKDFGIVGFHKEKFATYLILPRSLREYSGQRVVGIKYDALKSTDIVASGDIPRKKPAKPKKEKPKPKHFAVRVRITSIEEKEIELTAWTQGEAKAKALEEAKAASNSAGEHTKVAVVSARQLR